MADIEAIAKGLGIILNIADAILIKKKVDKLAGGSGGRTASNEDIKAIIKTTVKKPNMREVAGGVTMNKARSKYGKDMIKTTTLGKSKGGSVKTYAKGGGARTAKYTE